MKVDQGGGITKRFINCVLMRVVDAVKETTASDVSSVNPSSERKGYCGLTKG